MTPKSEPSNALFEGAPKQLLLAQQVANISDTAVRIPGIKLSVGLDSIIGLIPVVGDVFMLGASLSIIGWARRLGAPKPLLHKMIRNAVIDFLFGMVPVVGDVFDVFFKANKRNVQILEKWWVSENHAQIHYATQQKLKAWEDSQEAVEGDHDSER